MPIDINCTSAEELGSILQIDGDRAHGIIDGRREHGRFRSWDRIRQVPGFEDAPVERLPRAGT